MATRARINRWLEACDRASRTTDTIRHTLSILLDTPAEQDAAKFLARAGRAQQTAVSLRDEIAALIRALHELTPTPHDIDPVA